MVIVHSFLYVYQNVFPLTDGNDIASKISKISKEWTN